MVECNSIKIPNIYPNLNVQQQLRLNKISVVIASASFSLAFSISAVTEKIVKNNAK